MLVPCLLAWSTLACTHHGRNDTTLDRPDAFSDIGTDTEDATTQPHDPHDAQDIVQDNHNTEDSSPTAMFTASVRVEVLAQHCLPPTPADPVRFSGAITIANTGPLPIGPVTATTASIATQGGTELTRFALEPVNIPTINPGSTSETPVTKQPDSLVPSGCHNELCNGLVRVRIPISGPNVPPGTLVYSPLVPVSCTH